MKAIKQPKRKPLRKKRTIGSQSQKTIPNKSSSQIKENIIWEKWQVLTEHWQSDMKFYRDEIRFLRNLISEHFLELMEGKNVEKPKNLIRVLDGLEKNRQKHEQALILHQQHYRDIIENPFSHEGKKFADEQAVLETEVLAFIKRFNELKQEVFEVIEKILQSEKGGLPFLNKG